MGQMSTSMLCLVLLSLVVLAECFPSTYRGKPPDLTLGSNDGVIKLHSGDKQEEGTLNTMDSVTDTEAMGAFLHKNIPQTDSIPSNGGTPFTSSENDFGGSDSFTDLMRMKNLDGEDTRDRHFVNNSKLLNSSKRKTAHKDQYHLAQYNSLLDSYLRGFQRETIVLPQHRKSRHRRSFMLEYGISDDDTVIFSPHTSPCGHADRYYCHNGGTCVFVVALEIKTCR